MMNLKTKRIMIWTPRFLSILFAIFVSLFALDVFSEDYGIWETIVALLIHLVPTYLILIALTLAWRWEWVGAVAFIALGVFYLIWSWGEFEWVTYLVISGPLILVGVLFLVNWVYRSELRTK
jgi:hypothetical protein